MRNNLDRIHPSGPADGVGDAGCSRSDRRPAVHTCELGSTHGGEDRAEDALEAARAYASRHALDACSGVPCGDA